MFKRIAVFAGLFLLAVMFISPLRNYVNQLFSRGRPAVREEHIIGPSLGYNSRVREIQKILKEAGFEPGPVDGMMGSRTRKAIAAFQKEKGLWPSSKIDYRTWLELDKAKEALIGESVSSPLVLPFEKEAAEVKRKEDIAVIAGPQKAAAKGRIPQDRPRQIQLALEKAGFYRGKIDGKIGPQTKKAIVSFQKTKGLKPDGVVGPKTWGELAEYLKD